MVTFAVDMELIPEINHLVALTLRLSGLVMLRLVVLDVCVIFHGI